MAQVGCSSPARSQRQSAGILARALRSAGMRVPGSATSMRTSSTGASASGVWGVLTGVSGQASTPPAR